MFRRLHLPANAQNMFQHDVNRLTFRCDTLKFSRPSVSTLLKGKMFLINQKGSFCLSWNTPEEDQLCMAKQLSLGSISSDNGGKTLKLNSDVRRHVNMFSTSAFTDRCNRRYDHNLWFFQPYLWPDQEFDTLFMTAVANTVALNIIFEGLLFWVLSIMMTKQLLLKNRPNQVKTTVHKPSPR